MPLAAGVDRRAGDAISRGVRSAASTRCGKHEHLQRDLQLVGRKLLVQPHLYGAQGQAGRHRQRRQPLLRAEQGRRAAGRAAPLGDLQGPGRGLAGAARVARLDALHGGYAADRGDLHAAAVGEGAPHEHDGHRRRLPPARQHPGHAASGRRPRATTRPGGPPARARKADRALSAAPRHQAGPPHWRRCFRHSGGGYNRAARSASPLAWACWR